MHPVILQQIAAERVSGMIADADDARRARQARRGRRSLTPGHMMRPGQARMHAELRLPHTSSRRSGCWPYFRHLARIATGRQSPESLLEVQARYDTFFDDSPAWQQARGAGPPGSRSLASPSAPQRTNARN